jgi:hypothetical protein
MRYESQYYREPSSRHEISSSALTTLRRLYEQFAVT